MKYKQKYPERKQDIQDSKKLDSPVVKNNSKNFYEMIDFHTKKRTKDISKRKK